MSNVPGTSMVPNLPDWQLVKSSSHSWWSATVEVICCISFLSSMAKSNSRPHFQQNFRLCLRTLHLFSLLCNLGDMFSCFRIQNLSGLCHALCFWFTCYLLRCLSHLEASYITCCCCLCSYCTRLCHVFEAENCVITYTCHIIWTRDSSCFY